METFADEERKMKFEDMVALVESIMEDDSNSLRKLFRKVKAHKMVRKHRTDLQKTMKRV